MLIATGYNCNNGEEEEHARPREECSVSTLEAAPEERIECETENAHGEATGIDEVAGITVRFKGCNFGGTPATTPGLPAGEIQTNTLKGRLGYINKTNHEVGVLLEPAAAGGLFAKFEILEGILTASVGVGNPTEGSFYESQQPNVTPGVPSGHDGVISTITPISQMSHTFTQDYRTERITIPCTDHTCDSPEDHGFINVPSRFEGGPLEALEWLATHPTLEPVVTSAWGPAAQEITNVDTVEGEAEIKG